MLKIMKSKKIDNKRLMLRVSEMFYIKEISQSKIAETLGISRPTVAKLLKRAKEEGIVKISVTDPGGRKYYPIEHQLEDLYGLKEVFITETGDNGDSRLETGKAAAEIINRIITQSSIIGVAPGTTLNNIEPYLEAKFLPGTRFIPLVGGMGLIPQETHSNTISQKLAMKFCGSYYPIYAPARIDNTQLLAELEKEKSVQNVFNLAKKMDIAILGIGSKEYSTLNKTGYITIEDQKNLIKNGMVGDLCMQYYDINGNYEKFDLNKKVLTIDLKILREIEWSIGISFGEEKVDAIIGALNGKYINTLITDYHTAKLLLAKKVLNTNFV